MTGLEPNLFEPIDREIARETHCCSICISERPCTTDWMLAGDKRPVYRRDSAIISSPIQLADCNGSHFPSFNSVMLCELGEILRYPLYQYYSATLVPWLLRLIMVQCVAEGNGCAHVLCVINARAATATATSKYYFSEIQSNLFMRHMRGVAHTLLLMAEAQTSIRTRTRTTRWSFGHSERVQANHLLTFDPSRFITNGWQ